MAETRSDTVSRRSFLQVLGAGLLITVRAPVGAAGRRRGRSRRSVPVAARLHINRDGTVSVMTGKVEEGQGSRAQLTQAAAEELRLPAGRVRLIMADTALVPDDGITAGSRTTPYTVPAVRQGAAAARELLVRLAAERWKVPAGTIEVRNGTITDAGTKRSVTYADLAAVPAITEAFAAAVPSGVTVTPLNKWQVLGTDVARPNRRDLVTGSHRYPSDMTLPDMLHGKVLRPPSYGATLASIDLSGAQSMEDVVVVRDGEFVGCAAPTSARAAKALAALAAGARWKTAASQPSSRELFPHLKKHARSGGRSRGSNRGSIETALAASKTVLREQYEVAFIQHVPMETRAATAQWKDGALTVWTTVDWPQRAQRDLSRAFGVPLDRVRVVVPDMGGGFGGKHSAEAAEEAARLARAAGRPVAVKWTREEEFTWAYFRPAALIECRGGLDAAGNLTAWEFTNINAGGAAIATPYRTAASKIASVGSASPLRQGPYRCLAATANNFARESFMDELAAAAGADPLAFRRAHLQDDRIRTVLDEAARRFDWARRKKAVTAERGVGLACGTEKNSVVAACAEVAIDRQRGTIEVLEVVEAFECGPVQNPDNLRAQVEGCIVMGLGGALFEAMEFENGRILNPRFSRYRVPRFADVPEITVHLVENKGIPSAGGGETPIIAIAPAIGNAVFAATGVRLRSMPMRGAQLTQRG
jgi:isoquinoline 1-oxidoreductase